MACFANLNAWSERGQYTAANASPAWGRRRVHTNSVLCPCPSSISTDTRTAQATPCDSLHHTADTGPFTPNAHGGFNAGNVEHHCYNSCAASWTRVCTTRGPVLRCTSVRIPIKLKLLTYRPHLIAPGPLRLA